MKRGLVVILCSITVFALLIAGCSKPNSTQSSTINVDETFLSSGICEVKNNRDAILTIISDDGDLETGLNLNQLASFYDIPLTVAGVVRNIDPYLEQWQAIEKEGYIELISHSLTHKLIEDAADISSADLQREYIDALTYYQQNFETPTYAMVFPNNCTVSESYDLLADNGMIAIRQGQRGFNSLRPENGSEPGNWLNLKTVGIGDYPTVEEKNQLIDDVIENKQWLIEMWHNVTDSGGNTYQELSTQTASALFAYDVAQRNHGNLWIANFTDATAYLYQKENYQIRAWGQEDDSISILIERMTDDWPYDAVDGELTFFVVLPEDWENAEFQDQPTDIDCRIEQDGKLKTLYFNIQPSDDLTLKLVKTD